jgi:ABC-2 type transport system ATP-binding protein
VLDKIGYLPEEGSLIPTYTVLELCEYYGGLKLIKSEDIRTRLTMWLEEFHISEYMNKKIKDLSKGNRQKIQFIISVLHNPELLILDEPFSGLDPISVEELKSAILKLKEEGKTIIFSSHRMDHVETLCENIVIIEKGKTLLSGNLKEIIDTFEIDGVKGGHSLNDIFINKVGASNE